MLDHSLVERPKLMGLLRPNTAPVGKAIPRNNPVEDFPSSPFLDDPRHKDDSPMPWLRYFFPNEFLLREGEHVNPYYQYFDVVAQPLQLDASVAPPAWSPNAYFKLSFTQMHIPKGFILATREPKEPNSLGAVDITRDNSHLLLPKNEDLLREIIRFAESICTFQARTWKDAFPLVDLLRGVLRFLLHHYAWGAVIMREQARREAEEGVLAEKERLAKWYEGQLQEVEERARADYEAKLEEAEVRRTAEIAARMQVQLEMERGEKERLQQKLTQTEAQMKRLNEQLSMSEHTADQLNKQVDQLNKLHRQELVMKAQELREAAEEMEHVHTMLDHARLAVITALQAHSKEKVMNLAIDAIQKTMDGKATYIAELRDAASADREDPLPGLVAQIESLAQKGAERLNGGVFPEAAGHVSPLERFTPKELGLSPALCNVKNLSPGFFLSPYANAAGYVGSEGGSDTAVPATAFGSVEEVKESSVFRFIKAGHDDEFMLGQKLPYGRGVSWGLLDGQKDVYVLDVGSNADMHYFRPESKHVGSFLAVPILSANHGGGDGDGDGGGPGERGMSSGNVLGMLCVDTLPKDSTGGSDGSISRHLRPGEVEFIRGLAQRISEAAARDDEAFVEAKMEMAALAAEKPVEEDPDGDSDVEDPELYADMPNGLKIVKSVVGLLRDLTAGDLEKLLRIPDGDVDEATVAMVRSALLALGGSTGPAQGVAASWKDGLKSAVTSGFMEQLASAGSNPSLLGGWRNLSRSMKPVRDAGVDLETMAEDAGGGDAKGVSGTLARWLLGVRKVVAAQELARQMEEKLQKANMALLKAFAGDGSNALVELRSYRVAPKNTFVVLQSVLRLAGRSEEDCYNWAKVKIMINYKLVKHLIKLRPSAMNPVLLESVRQNIESLSAEDVKKESHATLFLFDWIKSFTMFGSSKKKKT